jgi:cobalt-zinc-cadmium efflux system membrane fusion protein
VHTSGVVLLALILGGCNNTPVEAGTQERTRVDPLQIAIGPTLKERIKLGTPKFRPVSASMDVAARVEADETRLARVSAPVTGRIVELNAYEGQRVNKGQVIATIYSTELSAAQSNFLKAVSQRQLAERVVARAKQLIDAGVIGEAEVQRRDTELQQAATDVSSAHEQLMVLGLTKDEIERLQKTRAVSSNTHIVSTIDGVVLERKATLGQVVQAVETVFVVADLSHVWLVADVPEQSAGSIQVGTHVQAEIPALPGRNVEGKLSFVSSIVNPETRTVRVRMNLPNPSGRYKPAMLATMKLVDSSQQQLVVPTAAVVREGNADVVFVQTAPDQFRMREVKAGGEFGDYRVISSGVTEDDTIVVDGAFHLNNERRRRALGDEAEGAS